MKLNIQFKDIDFRLKDNLIITCYINDLSYSDEYIIYINHDDEGSGYWNRQFILLHIHALIYGNKKITVYLDDKINSTCLECQVLEYERIKYIKLHLKTIK